MKLVEVIADADSGASIRKIGGKVKAQDVREGPVGEDGLRTFRLVVWDDHLQDTLDLLQGILGAQPTSRVLVFAVESAVHKPGEETQRNREDKASSSREALYELVEKSAQTDSTYVSLAALSTLVACIGLIQDLPAVVIGAMVIAPLLGPNLALSFGTALGDVPLMLKACRSLLTGLAVSVGLSMLLGLFWPGELESGELTSRTFAGIDSVILALASGAAAALSLVSGLSSGLVGVMVSVALLPPAAVFGMMLGAGEFATAQGAGLLLAVNIVCVNLMSKVVFFLKGIRPRTWLEKEKAQKAMLRVILIWVISLGLLLLGIVWREWGGLGSG